MHTHQVSKCCGEMVPATCVMQVATDPQCVRNTGANPQLAVKHSGATRGEARRTEPALEAGAVTRCSPLPTLLNGHESTCTRESPDETHSALRNTEHWARRKCYPFWITALFSKELTAPKEKTVPYGLDLLCWSYCDSATSTVLAYWYIRCSV